jgi:glycosyltransferase involved in cell wall biosynthesis
MDDPGSTTHLQAELDRLRAQVRAAEEALRDRLALQRELDRELVELRTVVRELETQLGSERRTLAFQLGQAVMHVDTLRGFLAMPGRVRAALRDHRARLAVDPAKTGARPAHRLRYVAAAIQAARRGGSDGAITYLRALPARAGSDKARAMAEGALALVRTDPAAATAIGMEAAALAPSEARLKALVWALYDEGHVLDPARLGDMLACHAGSSADRGRFAAIAADRTVLAGSNVAASPLLDQGTGGLAIITPRQFPHHADAWSCRARTIAEAAAANGRSVRILTEPGYRYPLHGDGKTHLVIAGDKLEVGHLPQPRQGANGSPDLVEVLADAIADDGIGCVHVVAHDVLAQAAVLAARRANKPYILDVGAIPACGTDGRPEWALTERFRAGLLRLSHQCRGASKVIARSAAIAEMLRQEVGQASITVEHDILPDGLLHVPDEPGRLRRELRVDADAVLVGIIGPTIVDDRVVRLLDAAALVRSRRPDVRFVFLGPGRAAQGLRRHAARMHDPDMVLVPDTFVRQRLGLYLRNFAVTLFPEQHLEPGLSAPFELIVAQAAGTPVVAVDSAWARDLLPASQRVDKAGVPDAIMALLDG